MKVAEAGGLLTIIAKTLRPLMVRAFPEVPTDHPAMGAMILNLSANALGLANAATPFGIRAMQELDTLNPVKGTASNAMALFLAMNTSSVTLLPTGVIALRVAAGSQDPAGILPTTLFATCVSTAAAFAAVKVYQRFSAVAPAEAPGSAVPASPAATPASGAEVPPVSAEASSGAYPVWVSVTALAGIVGVIPLAVVYGAAVSPWIIPGLMVVLLGFGAARRVRVYEVFVDGARDGFQVALRIIPYLVAILVAVAMLRASGALDIIVGGLTPLTSAVGLPGDALPMALMRPLSGSGAYGILASIIQDPAIGPDSYTGYLVSTFQGSTETTFYVLAVYSLLSRGITLPAAVRLEFPILSLHPGLRHRCVAPDVWGRRVAGGGAAAIVEEAGRHAGRLTGDAPRRAPAADGDAVAVEDQRAIGITARQRRDQPPIGC